jgi:uncharacterized protein YhfF
MTQNVERYWNQYLLSIPGGQEQPSRYVECFAFGFTPADAREIAQLVLNGTKTATGSLLWSYDADKKPLPIVGDLWIVMAASDAPMCIIQTTDVRMIPFDEVTADYAWDGGEEDRSLASWRAIYWEYIERACQRIGLEPNTKAPLVMERFQVVYAEPLRLGATGEPASHIAVEGTGRSRCTHSGHRPRTPERGRACEDDPAHAQDWE